MFRSRSPSPQAPGWVKQRWFDGQNSVIQKTYEGPDGRNYRITEKHDSEGTLCFREVVDFTPAYETKTTEWLKAKSRWYLTARHTDQASGASTQITRRYNAKDATGKLVYEETERTQRIGQTTVIYCKKVVKDVIVEDSVTTQWPELHICRVQSKLDRNMKSLWFDLDNPDQRLDYQEYAKRKQNLLNREKKKARRAARYSRMK